MKNIFLTAFFLLPAVLFAQQGTFLIKGKIGTYNAPIYAMISYRDAAGKDFTDSCIVKDGVFTFKGTLKKPVQGTLILMRNARPIWLEPGIMTISSPNDLNDLTIKGSKLNEDQAAWESGMSVLNEHYDALKAAAISRSFILSHPFSLYSIMTLRFYAEERYGAAIDVADLDTLFNTLSPEIRNTDWGKDYAADLEKWKKVDVGSMAPDFIQYDPSGKAVKLSDYKGKYILIDFWASWCHPCRAENPNLIRQYNLYKDKNFEIVSISLDTKAYKDQWLKAIDQDKLPWTQVSDLKEQNQAYVLYGVRSIPDNFLIDPSGKVIAKSLRGEGLSQKLKEVFSR